MSYGQNSMTAMLDTKPEESGNGEYWNDAVDNLSPVRKHLISTYLEVPDEEAMPLLGEYFGVALSFMALGALVRASNATKMKQKRMTEEDRLDLRACSRFERMALESMLKEAMERLRILSQNAYQMEERVRDLMAEDVAIDKERVQLLKKMADAEQVIQELRTLRKAEGRANERVMSIVASKEQDWLKEKRNLQKEVDRLRETVSTMTREAKFEARRCRNSNCEHCKGIDRVVKNVKGRISLRELNFRAAQSSPKREVHEVDRNLEAEEDRFLIKTTERKRQGEQPSHLKNQSKMERHGEWRESASTPGNSSTGAAGGSGQSVTNELLVQQQQDMESELASILKRVGMLKQRSNSSSPTMGREEDLPIEPNRPAEDEEVTQLPKDEVVLDPKRVEERVELLEDSVIREVNFHDSTLEVVDYSSDQEDYFSVEDEEESNLLELDKAFEFKDGKKAFIRKKENHVPSDDRGGNNEIQPESVNLGENSRGARCPSTADVQQLFLDEDAEFAAFERSLSLEVALGPAKVRNGGELSDGINYTQVMGEAVQISGEGEAVSLILHGQGVKSREQDVMLQATTEVLCTGDASSGQVLQHEPLRSCKAEESVEGSGISQDADATESPESCSRVGQVHEVAKGSDEQRLLELGSENDRIDCPNALSLPVDAVTGVGSAYRNPCSVDVDVPELAEQDHSGYGSGLDVQENLSLKDCQTSLEGRLLENQDIPLFERNNVDELAGELPEPEEKRVCSSVILDDDVSGSHDELLSSLRKVSYQEENPKDINRVPAQVELEQAVKNEGLSEEDVGLVTNGKQNSYNVVVDGIQSQEETSISPVSE